MPERDAPKQPHRPRVEVGEPQSAELTDDATLDGLAIVSPAWAGKATEFVEVRSCRITGGSLAGSTWHRAAWADIELSDADIANARFTESGWTRVAAHRCRGTGLNLAGAQLSDVVLRDCRVDLANLRYAIVKRCHFVGCQLSGTELIGATLTDVVFTDCHLDGADFSNARCTRVRLEGCRLDGLKGITGLGGATIDALDIFDVAHQLAAALRIRLA